MVEHSIKIIGSLDVGFINFAIIDGHQRSCAELSRMPDDTWYFNRLFVPEDLRNGGRGAALVKEVVNFSKENGILILLELNPYGDLNYAELEGFYLKNGFMKIKEEDAHSPLYLGDLGVLDEDNPFRKIEALDESVSKC